MISTLTLRGRVTRIYALINWAFIGPDNGLAPARRQAIIWTSTDLFLIGPFGITFYSIPIKM